jgi:hypothetical protein
MEKNDMIGKIAIWAFIIGTVLALILGLYHAYTVEAADQIPFFATDAGGWIAWLLALIGVIVGILAILGRGTITKSEVPSFLLAGVALLVMYAVFRDFSGSLDPWLGSLLAGISFPLAIFIAPAVGLLAIKACWDIGKSV